jgi:hypothetical protein
MAARAHDAAALCVKGASASSLNFPELAASLPRPVSLSHRDIQAAAAEAAAMDPEPELSEIVELPRLDEDWFERCERDQFVWDESPIDVWGYAPPWMDTVDEHSCVLEIGFGTPNRLWMRTHVWCIDQAATWMAIKLALQDSEMEILLGVRVVVVDKRKDLMMVLFCFEKLIWGHY